MKGREKEERPKRKIGSGTKVAPAACMALRVRGREGVCDDADLCASSETKKETYKEKKTGSFYAGPLME